jgi:glycosyltransferase involved in cell wall biosynthesis
VYFGFGARPGVADGIYSPAMETIGATPLRLLFVTSGLTRGGAEGFLVRLAVRLSERGHSCAVASFGARSPLAEPLAAAGIEVAELGTGFLLPSLRLARLTARFRPDVIQGWMYRGNLAALLTASLARTKPALVWSVRQGLNDLPTSPWSTRFSVWLGARLSRRPDAIVYNAQSALRQHTAVGFAPARARVIPNGIDVSGAPRIAGSAAATRSRLGLPESSFVVAMPARWHPVKNHRGFVRAAGVFARRRPEARFLMAGHGVDATNSVLASWLSEEGIADRVVPLGERSDLAEILAAVDVVTLASHGEALPNALLEAMAAGVPCVATDVGDIEELIGTTGIVVRRDDANAMAAGWEELAAMTDLERRALGDRARGRVAERYGLDRAVLAFESLYLASTGE